MTGAAAATAYRERMRDAVAAALLAKFADEPDFIGLMEGGSAATGRLDEHSDIDFGVIAEPERYDFGWRCLHFDLPQPPVSGFFRLAYVGSLDALRAAFPAADALAQRLLEQTAHLS